MSSQFAGQVGSRLAVGGVRPRWRPLSYVSPLFFVSLVEAVKHAGKKCEEEQKRTALHTHTHTCARVHTVIFLHRHLYFTPKGEPAL